MRKAYVGEVWGDKIFYYVPHNENDIERWVEYCANHSLKLSIIWVRDVITLIVIDTIKPPAGGGRAPWEVFKESRYKGEKRC